MWQHQESAIKPLKDDWQPNAQDLPCIIPPLGLSLERQWYLYERIREFCPEEDRDAVCPRPSTPKQ